MSIISIRLNDRDEHLIKEYAKASGSSVSDLMRSAVIEMIEDQIDLALFDKAIADMKTTHTLEDVKSALDIA